VGRRPPSLGEMTISVVLRLIESAVASGRLAGEAQLVRSGERTEIRDAAELLAFLQHDGEPTHEAGPTRERRGQ
jgi:hypothetical protein